MPERIPESFLNYAAGILAATESGLSGAKIVEYCNAWAVDCNVDTPHSSYPFEAPNKRTALQENLAIFSPKDQYDLLLDLCDRFGNSPPDAITQLRAKIMERFGSNFSTVVKHEKKTDMASLGYSATGSIMTVPIQRPLRVFLCHAADDKPRVRELYEKLKRDGFSPWLDEMNLLAGQDWQLEIKRAVRESDEVLACLSKRSTTKFGYVNKEISIALDMADERPEGAIFIIPALLEDCQVPERLSKWHYVKEFEPNGYVQICEALKHSASDLPTILGAVRTASTAVPLTQTELVTLDSTLRYLPGWEAVKVGLAKRLKREFGDSMRVTIMPVPDSLLPDLEEGYAPYPEFIPSENRLLYYALPIGLNGGQTIRSTVECIYDFLLQAVFPDESEESPL